MAQVQMKTTMGDMMIELDSEAAPVSVKNFLEYANNGFYNGTIFHRVIKGFMVQGGGMDKEMNSKPNNDPIINEAANGLKNDRGTLAMARTSDPDSATNQFFINHKDNDFLNYSAIVSMCRHLFSDQDHAISAVKQRYEWRSVRTFSRR